ncbi:hypothetical protein [Acinetobacter sp. 10FS3-1]|uniref:hypothetical protein n=1 Tax=Acinetobacter sp. 10FS3-1 TaxID=2563897 RepID=UPI00157CC669|nr:hypothetical protein [Acinetobacter sp. 10FS3-1]QKQ69919.1 hypothetical protein E5Y90_06575 [Acinetobacter sp. 10FS3-1]
MRVSGIDSMMSIDVKEGVELPKFIRTLTVETAEEEQQLRLFLTGALKVDEHGCHALGRDFRAKALAVPCTANGDMSLGNGGSMDAVLKVDYSLEEKLRIIDTLTAAIQHNEPMMYSHTKEAETKLLALVQSI